MDSSLIKEIEASSFPEAVRRMAELFPGQIVFSSSLGQEDQVITDLVFRNKIPVKVFTIDTGRLFPETYELLDRTVARYKKIHTGLFPGGTRCRSICFPKRNKWILRIDRKPEGMLPRAQSETP